MNEDLRNWLQQEIKVRQPISCINSLLPLPSANIEADLPKEIDQFIRRHDKIICSIGVFITNYGFKQIARAVDSIRKEKNLNIGLLFIDGAFTVDSHYKSEVLENRSWIAVAESLPHPNVLNILKNSDAFIRNVASESYGLSRVEALWCGTPVVATRVGETRGMLLFDYGNETELIAQIKEALFNPLIKKNIHFWAERFHNKAKENLQALMSIADHKKESND
jgi:glycosyltransferase involved in cell wall biosynthesis